MAREDAMVKREIISEIDDGEHSIAVAQGVVSAQEAEIQEIKSQGRSINRQLGHVNVRISGLVAHLERITSRINSTDTRLNRLDGHLSRVDTRLYGVDTHLRSLDAFIEVQGQDNKEIKHYLGSLEQHCDQLAGRIETLEQRFDGLEKKMDMILELLTGGEIAE
jgi:chromosome segregation ATPase